MSFAARSLWILHRIHLGFLRVEFLEPELHFLLLGLLRVHVLFLGFCRIFVDRFLRLETLDWLEGLVRLDGQVQLEDLDW